MSTWISEASGLRRLVNAGAALVMSVALAGCLAAPGAGGSKTAPKQSVKAQAPLARVELAQGRVVVPAFGGYCIAPEAVKRQAGGFAVIASCSGLGAETAAYVEPALMTVTVLPRRLGSEPPSADALVASLAPAKARLTRDGDGVVLAHLETGGDAGMPGGDPRYWRAAMEINGHLVGLALYGPKGSDLAGQAGELLIRELAEQLRDASSASATAKQTPLPKSAQPVRFLGRLFPKRG